MRRKLYKHLIETNYRNIASIIKQFKKARNKKKNQNRRGGASRRRGRRRGRRCDICLKFDIRLLTNNNLRHDDLDEVAYFVRALS